MSYRASIGAVAGLLFLSSGASGDTVFWSDDPHHVVVLTEVAPGEFGFTEDYSWYTDNAGDPHILGDWADKAWSYTSVAQDTTFWQDDRLNLQADPRGRLDYKFVIPVDGSLIDEITIAAQMRNVTTGRVRATENDSFGSAILLASSSAFVDLSAVVDIADVDTSTPGQVSFFLKIENEANSFGGGIFSLDVTATTVPEPASLGLLAFGAVLMSMRRTKQL